MKWIIPGKTFLLGEYAALANQSAIVLTTSPCFALSLQKEGASQNINPHSPAGKYWTQQAISDWGLLWHDPYKGRGGVGASSAQFLGAYLASCYLQQRLPDYDALLASYYQAAWQGRGLKPSGYDVLAQLQNRCVYINWQNKQIKSYDWVFSDISFLLIHSGCKLATHNHLENVKLPKEVAYLSETVEFAKLAFEEKNSAALIEAVNTYQAQLVELNLMEPQSIEKLKTLKTQSDVLAAKGCGALGTDILLLIVPDYRLKAKVKSLTAEGWLVLATTENLYTGESLLKKEQKTLEILI